MSIWILISFDFFKYKTWCSSHHPLLSHNMIAKGIRATAILLFLLLATCTPTSSATATCYYPDGTIASNNVPCSSDTYSACCGKSDVCLSNNLCMDTGEQPYVLSRGACTDPNWESDNCPSVCRTYIHDTSMRLSNCIGEW
ncbi:hypothetical protein BO83DRAFT_87284 [Aspergillus eucalypticola CBS 122712]|uniref:Uncharacterized protein n=1 Tax=Aspergillus eucalypticola (strain CBS 122712 / IBT 29274) TaxID=1448314 RepID=A0A317V1D9_ASPEC|nr:uncharacterized protein BO83DRAFT_87284 [Aspergillus eucalypticola CBS 122712]PWY68144.1 hypothetical protein BO83DRAFT_87284 [Aspergillus eucalypticola CBS 122712]